MQVFDFKDYKEFLSAALQADRQRSKGAQARLAEHLRCRSAYLSMVTAGRAELSVEQAAGVADYFQLTERETHYFILLVQRARAGTVKLRYYFDRQISAAMAERAVLARRVETTTELDETQKAVMYSAWYYAAIHLALTVPTLQTSDELQKYFRLPRETVSEVLEFLVRSGLAVRNGDRYIVGPTRIHLPATSPFHRQSHSNWRMQALQSLQRPNPDHLHYSSIVSASRRDLPKVREVMMRAVDSIRAIIRESPEEDLFCYEFDLFSLRQ
jgi:uncharacterized protein (TIGR02147 family)